MLLNVLLVSPALLILVPPRRVRQKKMYKPNPPIEIKGGSNEEDDKLDPLPVRPFITAYRGAMMIITCLAILAVDFKVFPRRFAKVETWGTSLMDMGVGSFVFSAGVVSVRPILKDRLAGRTTRVGSRLYMSAKHSLPIFVLGLVRLYSVKGLDLAEHVTEYGVHWNNFFTLAFLPPSVALIESLTALIPSTEVLSILLGGLYQASLEFTGLKAFILTAPRTDFFRQNREGIFSFFGYLAIFLAGQAAGFDILKRCSSNTGSSTLTVYTQRKRLLLRLIFASAAWNLLFFFTTSYTYGLNLRVSRRLANLPYILWVAAFNCTQLTLFCAIETWSFPEVYKAMDKNSEKDAAEKATSKVLRVFNRNGLAIFILANPLTGLVNLTLDTLTMSREGAMCILLGYAVLLTAVAVALDRWNISIKL